MVDINVKRFLDISTLDDLANYFGIPCKELSFFAFSDKSFYKSFLISKRSDCKMRTIDAPAIKLKRIQRIIADTLYEIYEAPDAVHGFVKDRSIATNALQHVKKRSIVKIDLKDFFPSITAKRIHGLFRRQPFFFNERVSNALTNLVCYEGRLPQGAPSSPILSNMICFKMDCGLMQFARQHKLKYTRYADDLTFSSTTKRAIALVAYINDDGLISIDSHIESIIESNGFHINPSKTGIFSSGTRQLVTGIVVNKKCNFRRDDYRYIRGLFYCWKRNGAEFAARRYVGGNWGRHYESRFFSDDGVFSEGAFIAHVYGLLSYYSMVIKVNGCHSRPLQRLWTNFHDITGLVVPEMLPERSIFQIDSCAAFRVAGKGREKYGCTGTAFLLEGKQVVSARHCVKSQVPADFSANYEKGSFFDLLGCSPVQDISYVGMVDSTLDDWMRIPAPEKLRLLPGLQADFDYCVQEKETVTAYGFADGKRQLRKIQAEVVDRHQNEIIVDRAFISGMSGGPVFNSRGDVIGIITKGSSDGVYDRDGRFIPIGLAFAT